ncbi:protein cholesin [Petromyzon marinus]|uniref:protein cholesin n=1 Tax=Petromyzon marinus TaxID=7757 RepID=UPI003F6FD02D
MAKGKRAKATDVGEVTRKKKRTLNPDAERKADEKRARRKTRGKALPAEDCAEAVKDKGKKTDEVEEEEGEAIPEMSVQEERVLERKVKKLLKKAEKEKTKQATATAVKSGEAVTPSAAELSLEYLKSWATDKEQWKFQKLRQTWLLQHMYDAEKVPDSYFRILLKYLAGLKGQAKDTTIEKAESIMRKSEVEEEEEAEKAEEEKGNHVDEEKKKRVRKVLKMLS